MSERFGCKRNGGRQKENSARLYKTSKPLNALFKKKLWLCRSRYSILSEVHMITHGNEIKIFAGNSNRPLAEAIAKRLNTELGGAEVGCFSDGETSVHIDETVRGRDLFIIQSTSAPVNDNLMELLILIDAARRASAGRITAVMPYFGYARQDRKARSRDPITAKLVADLITAAGADRVLTMDLHAAQIQGFFNIPLDHLLGRWRSSISVVRKRT